MTGWALAAAMLLAQGPRDARVAPPPVTLGAPDGARVAPPPATLPETTLLEPYAVSFRPGRISRARTPSAMRGHADYWRGQRLQGRAPSVAALAAGARVVVLAGSLEEAQRLAAADPAVASGLLRSEVRSLRLERLSEAR